MEAPLSLRGGALFRADVEARRRTGNKGGLEHAMRAIIAEGGTIGESWSMDRVIATGDGAIGAPVLRELYDATKDAPSPFDLEALWKELGIVHAGKTISFDNHARLADIRRAITAK